MSRQDELLALSQQQATQQALKSIQDDAATTTAAYQQAVASGDTQNAAWQLRSLAALVDEYQRIAGPQQQQAQQRQQQQSPYTQAEIEWLNRHPAYAQDPRKFAEIVMSANALVSRGYDRNSPEYLHALDLSAGDTPDSAESPLTPDEVCKISGISADEYNKNAADLMTLKSVGLYRDGR